MIEAMSVPEDGLPWPPMWRIQRDQFVAVEPDAQIEALIQLAGDQPGYWVLHQGAMAPGSQRQLLANLDSAVSLRTALNQHFLGGSALPALMVQRLPTQKAAGILFSRHPQRPDLDHIVIEGGGADEPVSRLILHRDGALAWRSDDSASLVEAMAALHDLATLLAQHYASPMAAEWVWDGDRLWVIQVMTIGSLPMPQEAWTKRSAASGGAQAISPLWYTLWARWLKAGFWRPLGVRAGWQNLSNIEPFRRQHSHLYLNSQFPRALQRWRRRRRRSDDVPPAWRESATAYSEGVSLLQRQWLTLRLALLERQLKRQQIRAPADLWLALMACDGLGEKLAALHGQLNMIWLPEWHCPEPAGLSASQVDALQALVGQKGALTHSSMAAPGLDPAWPRWSEQPPDVGALRTQLLQLPEARRRRISTLEGSGLPLMALRARLDDAVALLATRIRGIVQQMAGVLYQKRILKHPDDVFFLYFDELWQCWRGQPANRLAERLAERKVRYLTDAHSGPPDWIIDQVGYGTSTFARENRQPLLQGKSLVGGQAQGPARRLGSGWQLNQVQAGDILILDRCDPGWLPWLCLAGGVLLAHQDPLDPAASLVHALGIPAVWGVDDAMHSVVDGDMLNLDGDQGVVTPIA
jgi:rifampicin phosphotransferase